MAENTVIESSKSTAAAARLAEAVVALPADFFTDEVRQASRRAVLDLLGCAVAGGTTSTVTGTRSWVADNFAQRGVSVWFTPETSTVAGAVVVNATAGSILDGDDLHWASWLHAGAALVPAALAEAEASGATFEEMLDALAVGYETCCRIAQFVDWDTLGQIATGHWCAYGVAATVGRLRGVSADQLAKAFTLAAALTPTVLPRGATINQNDVKEGIPWGSLAGVHALDLAGLGLSGPESALDIDVTSIEDTLNSFGTLEPAVCELAFKPYVSCAWTHVGVDVLRGLMAEHELTADDIERVDVLTFSDVTRHLQPLVSPETIQEAQYSYPFVLGVVAYRGIEALLPLGRESLHDANVERFAAKVSITSSAEFDRELPANRPVQLRLQTSRGTFEGSAPRENNPATGDQVRAKFTAMAQGAWPAAHAAKVADLVLHGDSMTDLVSAMKQPLDAAI